MIRFDNHAFKGLDDSLRQLYEMLTAMGDGTQQLIALLKPALKVADPESFVRAKEIDKTVNEAEMKVDSAVAAIINKFTVMGEDLRFTLAAVKISGTLERAADKIKNCTKRLSRIAHPIDGAIRTELSTAIDAVAAMMPLALGQVIEYKPEATERLLAHGATVQQSYRAILLHLHAHQSPADTETHILLVAKNLEQAADMAVEIMKVSHHIHFATKFDKRAGAQQN
ncbi:MAG: phosphate signaling complex PhoU family protein [Rickettsiales bacterium]